MVRQSYEDMIAEHMVKGWRIEDQTPTHNPDGQRG